MAFGGLVDTTRSAAEQRAENMPEWQGFAGGARRAHIDVAEFIRCHVHPYTGGAGSPSAATGRTSSLWRELGSLFITRSWRGRP